MKLQAIKNKFHRNRAYIFLFQGSADEFNERDAVRGARNATTETYQSDRRGSEYRNEAMCSCSQLISASLGGFIDFTFPILSVLTRFK